MTKENEAVTPVEDIQTDEVQAEETEATSEELAEQIDNANANNNEDESETQEDVETDEVDDYRQKYEALEREVKQLKSYIASQNDDEEGNVEEDLDLGKDAKDFLTKFAENPREVLEKVVSSSTKKYEKMLDQIRQQNAIDYIQSQKDFTPDMYDDLLYIINGPERNRMFNYNNATLKLKDLPPRQKAEAALQIYRASKDAKTQQKKQRPKPLTTTKAKPTAKSNDKADELLSAEEFLKKHGLDKVSL